MSLPCGLCVCASLPSGPSPSPLGSGFYRLLLVLGVLIFRHFLVVLASTRHFLLALCHPIPAPRSTRRFRVAFPPVPPSGGAFLVSYRATPAHASPHFIDLALPPGPALVLGPSPVFRSSGHDAAAQPYHPLLYSGAVRAVATANLYLSPGNAWLPPRLYSTLPVIR